MSPIRNITTIAADILDNGKNIPQNNSMDLERTIERFLATLELVFIFVILVAWILCLVLHVYEIVKHWKKHSPTLDETKTSSKHLDMYFVEGCVVMTTLFESKNRTKSYGTISQVQVEGPNEIEADLYCQTEKWCHSTLILAGNRDVFSSVF